MLIFLGIFVLVTIYADIVSTTVSVRRAGFLTWHTSSLAWRAALMALRVVDNKHLRTAIGPSILCLVAGLWIAATWIGWTLIFMAIDGGLQHKDLGKPVTLVGILGFVGSSLSTAGSSLLSPTSPLVDLLSVLVAINGMVVVTLSVSFLLSLSQTVLRGRAFALEICSARTAEQLDMPGVYSKFVDLCVALSAYPMALFFAPQKQEASIPDAIFHLAKLTHQLHSEQSGYAIRTLEDGLKRLPTFPSETRESSLCRALHQWSDRYSVQRQLDQGLRT